MIRQPLVPRREVFGAQVGVARHHRAGAPTAQFLQDRQWRALLNMPGREGMSQVVKTQWVYSCPPHGAVSGCGRCRCRGLAAKRENPFSVLADLLVQNGHGFAIEGHRDRASRLGLVGVDPCHAAIEIDLNFGFTNLDARWTAINNYTYAPTMGLPIGGDPK